MMAHTCRYASKHDMYFCPECGEKFATKEECQAHIPEAPVTVVPPTLDLTTTPEVAPEPVVEFGEYISHKSPTPREGDTLLGKVLGYLSELLFWADQEGKCSTVDALWPEIWPIEWVDNIFISIFQGHYNGNYQKQYNRGADQGNKFHQAIFGWIDDAKATMEGIINDVRNKIETDLINPIKDKLSTLNDQINDFNVKMGDFTSKIGQFDIKIDNFSTDISSFKSKIDGFKNDLSTAFTKLGDLDSLTSTLKGKIGDVETLVSNVENKIKDAFVRVNDAEAKLGAFESRLVDANNLLKEHTFNINDLIERVKTLEAPKEPPTIIPKLPTISIPLGKPKIEIDPDIREEKSPINGFRRFISSWGLGNRIWVAGSDIGTKTVKVSVNVPAESINHASIEMNGSYGWAAVVKPGEGTKTFTSTSTGLNKCPRRYIASSEQPDQPFARVDGADLNIWFHGGIVDVNIEIIEQAPKLSILGGIIT